MKMIGRFLRADLHETLQGEERIIALAKEILEIAYSEKGGEAIEREILAIDDKISELGWSGYFDNGDTSVRLLHRIEDVPEDWDGPWDLEVTR